MPIGLKALPHIVLAGLITLPAEPAWCQPGPAATSSSAEAELEEVPRVVAEALRLQEAGRIADAIPLAERVVAITERRLGPEHQDTLTFARFLARLYQAERRYAEAEALFRRGAEVRERVLGEAHPDTILALDELAKFFWDKSQYAEAGPLLSRLLEYRENALGRDHVETLQARNDLCVITRLQSLLTEAGPLCRRALDESERALGREHRSTIASVNNLATLLQDQGRYAEAEPLFRRAWEDSVRIFGRDDSQTLAYANNLAVLLQVQGRYADAEPLLRRGLEVRQRTLGQGHRETILSAITLADLYQHQGRYAEAEVLYQKALTDGESLFGPQSPTMLLALNNLATLYRTQRRYADAEPLYKRVLNGREEAAGADHPLTLLSVTQLATVYQDQRRHSEAEPLYRRALLGSERALGPAHPDTLNVVGNLADLYLDQGRYAEAEPLMRRSLNSRESLFGRDHPATLISVNNLAVLYSRQGRHPEAQELHRRAVNDRERVLGPHHPDTIFAMENLVAANLASRTVNPEALNVARRYLAARLERRQQGSTAEQSRTGRESNQRDAVRFALFADAAWEAAASGHAARQMLLPEAFGAIQESLTGSADRAIAEQAAQRYARDRNSALLSLIGERQRRQDEWAVLDGRLAQAFGGSGEVNSDRPTSLRAELERVQARIDAIDGQLQLEAPEYFSLIQPRPLTVKAARELLEADEAVLLVAPSQFGTHLVAITREGIEWRRSPWTANEIRAAVQRLRWDLGARVSGDQDELARLQRDRPANARARFDRTTAHQLYQQLIEPTLSSMIGKKRLFIAAGGGLAGLPFSVLVSATPAGADDSPGDLRSTRWFADDFELTHIPSIQSLAILRSHPRAGSNGSSLIGIGNPTLATTAAARRLGTTRGLLNAQQVFARGRTRQGTPADLGALRAMPSLPGTEEELQQVRERLQAPASALYMGARATELAIRGLDFTRARLVLFATHGLTAEEAGGVGEPGLVLTPPAMPSTGPEDYTSIDPANDGYLAASEVTTLRMDTDWVVLSACNTATGDDNANLSALARAFFYAGARNLLASHWPVSDEVAPILISNTVAVGPSAISRGGALQRAMRKIRNAPDHSEWAHPFYWAPFVLIGDGGEPLQ